MFLLYFTQRDSHALALVLFLVHLVVNLLDGAAIGGELSNSVLAAMEKESLPRIPEVVVHPLHLAKPMRLELVDLARVFGLVLQVDGAERGVIGSEISLDNAVLVRGYEAALNLELGVGQPLESDLSIVCNERELVFLI